MKLELKLETSYKECDIYKDTKTGWFYCPVLFGFTPFGSLEDIKEAIKKLNPLNITVITIDSKENREDLETDIEQFYKNMKDFMENIKWNVKNDKKLKDPSLGR